MFCVRFFHLCLNCNLSLFSDTGLCEPEPNECHLFPLKTREAASGHQLIQNRFFLDQLIEQNEVAMMDNNYTSNSRHGTRQAIVYSMIVRIGISSVKRLNEKMGK
jgi:hypothetical protein